MITQDYTPCSECGYPHVPRGMYYLEGRHICPNCIQSSINRKMRESTDEWTKEVIADLEIDHLEEMDDGDDVREKVEEELHRRFGI